MNQLQLHCTYVTCAGRCLIGFYVMSFFSNANKGERVRQRHWQHKLLGDGTWMPLEIISVILRTKNLLLVLVDMLHAHTLKMIIISVSFIQKLRIERDEVEYYTAGSNGPLPEFLSTTVFHM